MISSFFFFLRREILLARARLGDHLAGAAFFLMIATLFPLAVGPGPNSLRALGISVIWIAGLLSSLPAFDRIFADDWRGGWLEQISLSPASIYSYILAKLACWYIFTALPVVIITPLMMLFFGLAVPLALPVMASLMLGLGSMVLLGGVGGALTLGARRSAILVAMLILPLAIPVLVFGVMGCEAVVKGHNASAHFSLLGAIFLILLVIAPLASAAGLRSALEDG